MADPLPTIDDELKNHHQAKRPRVAFIDCPEEIVGRAESFCGTARTADSLNDYLSEWPWSETDMVVSPGRVVAPQSLHVLTWGLGGHDLTFDFSSGSEVLLVERVRNLGRELKTPVDTATFAAAIDDLLESASRSDTACDGLRPRNAGLMKLVVSTEKPIAAIYSRRPNTPLDIKNGESNLGIGLAIPEEADPVFWLRGFLELLAGLDPSTVPAAPARLNHPEHWYTPAEVAIAERIRRIGGQVEELRAELRDLQAALQAEGELAEDRERAVLWRDGDDLEEAVATLLGDLGFAVRLLDREIPPGQPRREDYHITLDGKPEWVVIGECKGYTKGARANDLAEINKHVKAFVREQRREPDRVWWVINDHRNEDPSGRALALQGHRDRPVNFDVVAVPTRDLFRLWRDVALHLTTQEVAQQTLMSCEPGVFQYEGLDRNTS